MASTSGRRVVVPLTNKSGGAVAAGDVVIIDTSNDTAFTTTTSGGYTGTVGVAQEAIANNATGRVCLAGAVDLVNVNASVTRGNWGKTHTVVKQATGVGARAAGTFCQFSTGGTTPAAILYPVDLAGTALTNPMSAVGDIIQGTTAGAPAALAAPLAGKVLTGAGVTTPLVYSYPPGYELDYVQITSPVTCSATTEATANTCITGSAVAYDGSTRIKVEWYAPYVASPAAGSGFSIVTLYDGSSSIGFLGLITNNAGTALQRWFGGGSRFLTPSNASHTYSIRMYVSGGSADFGAGAGGAAAHMPAYIRITKA